MVAVLNSSLLAARSTGTQASSTEITSRVANGDTRVAVDIGFAKPARDPNDPVTVKTLFDTQVLATAVKTASGVSPATPGIDPFAVRVSALLAAQSAENRTGISNAARASALFEAALEGIAEIKTKLERLEELAADAALTDLDTTDDHEPPTALSSQQRSRLNTEFAALRAEIDTLVGDKVVDGTNVLGGFSFSVAFGGGGQAGDSATVGVASAASADLAAGFDTADISTLATATAALANVQTALDTLGDIEAQARGAQNRLGYASNALADAAGVADAERGDRLTPVPETDTTRDVAKGVLEERGINEALAGQDINLTLYRSLAAMRTPDASKDAGSVFDTGAPDTAAPEAAPVAAYTTEPTGQNLSISV